MNQHSSREELSAILTEADQIVRETRRIIRAALRKGFEHRLKADRSFVTDVDLAVEDKTRRMLRQRFPEHGILGEERGGDRPGSDYQWIIDPIDGTHSLRHRVPLFGTLLALLHRDEPVLGVIDLPALDKTYSGARGLGTKCNGRVMRVADLGPGQPLEEEIISVGERPQFTHAGKARVFDHLMKLHPSVRTYCDCFGHALAIEGAVGAMVDFDLRIWDTSATAVLVAEAGGKYVSMVRTGTSLEDCRYDVVFGKPRVVDWVLALIKRLGNREELP